MVFSSPVFLFLFLPLCLLAALGAARVDRLLHARVSAARASGRHPVQNFALLMFSLAFYAYGSGWHVLIMLGSCAISHLGGLAIASTRHRKLALVIGVFGQLCVLGYFKYANFFVDQVSAMGRWLGAAPLEWRAVVLPIGVSFFVFHSISYLIDIYRKKCEPRRNPLDVALYLSLFPQLVAGPIVRYNQIASQLDDRSATVDDIARGAVRFVYGLCKKVLVADAAGAIADAAFGLGGGELTTAAALLGAFAYTFQIYFDFSAYSDMALGLGRMFGFHFPENFNRPLTAASITDFWRRWHMTLSFWFRDYVYVPLGGSQSKGWRTYGNLWAVFLLSGLWHGASWTFVAWGAYHGALLTIERIVHTRTGARLDQAGALRRALTFLLVVVGFTLFRATSFGQALDFFAHMFAPRSFAVPLDVAVHLTHKNLLLFAVAASSLLLPPSFVIGRWLESAQGTSVVLARFVVMTLGVLCASAVIASNHFSPFIYFQF